MLWMGNNYAGCSSLAVGAGQWETVFYVELDSHDECFGIVAVEEHGIDSFLTPQNGSLEPMHAVDDLHFLAVDKNWWQRMTRLRQQPCVLGHLARQSG
jgi:hypothetical protein